MALVFPAPPLEVGRTFEADNNVTYTWDGTKWLGVTNEAGVQLTAPVLDSATLTDTLAGDRFNEGVFRVGVTQSTESPDQGPFEMRASVNEDPDLLRITTRPTSDTITNVETIQYADSIAYVESEQRGYQRMIWAGPPFNRYIVTASSVWAWSTDGINWTEIPAPTPAPSTWGIGFCYRSVNQRLYCMEFGIPQTMYTISTVEQLEAGTNNGENWTHSNFDQNDFRGHMSYDERNDRICMIQGDGNKSRIWLSVTPFPANFGNAGWVNAGGQFGGSNALNNAHVIDTGTASYYVGVANQADATTTPCGWACGPLNTNSPAVHGFQNTNKDGEFPIVTFGYGGRPAYHPTLNRWFFNGLYWDGDIMSAPTAPSSWTVWADNISPNAQSTNKQFLFYAENIDRMVLIGNVKPPDTFRNPEMCHWISDDGGDTWTEHLSRPFTHESGNWVDALWADNLGRWLLCSSDSTVNGRRLGTTVRFSEPTDTPRLTFASSAGLGDFTLGEQVHQDDDAGAGTAAVIDTFASTMVVQGSTGTFSANTNNVVLGEDTEKVSGHLILDANLNVLDISPVELNWRALTGNGPWDITFPATFATGGAPNDVLQEGTVLRAEIRRQATVDNFTATSTVATNVITPPDTGGGGGGGGGTNTLTLTSPEFANGNAMPDRVGARGAMGADLFNPELTWTFEGDGTVASYRLTCIDPDGGDFVHWNVTDIPATATGIGPQSRDTASNWPAGTTVGATGWTGVDDSLNTNNGWGAATPPSGTHNYNFTLDALDADGNVLATGTLTGTYAA